MKVLVLSGGVSNEREVSLRSGTSVRDALTDCGHEVYVYDPQQGYDGLAKFLGKVDCVFPILHGRGGEDGAVQLELEKLGFKYLGSDSRVSKLCFDKSSFKEILNKLSILTPKSELVTKLSIGASPLLRNPYVLIDGTELTVPVLGATSLPVIEIIPPKNQEFDYENKYNGATQELCPPQHIDTPKQQEAQRLAELIHNQVGARHLSRTDIILDREGKMWVLELNTMPGLTDQSLFPKAAQSSGMSMPQLVQRLVDLVMA
jgi:D-alanine-D-alanine ligase